MSHSIPSSLSQSGTAELLANPEHAKWDALSQTVVAYAAANGISMVADSKANLLIHAPVTLLPTFIDRSSFTRVVNLSNTWNQLVDRLSRDPEFLQTHLKESAQADEWLAKLLDMYLRLEKEGIFKQQPIRFGVYRSDYMIHAETDDKGLTTYTPQQIELNTIAASFAGLSTRVAAMHRFMLQREFNWSAEDISNQLPANNAITGIAAGFHAAYEQYKQRYGGEKLVVVMVVQPGESNAVDQRILEYTLWEKHQIPLMRRSLAEIKQNAKLQQTSPSSPATELVLDGEWRVAIVYFRAGYTPKDFPSNTEFESLELIERSMAIKCPTLGTHLAGTKKVQQVLSVGGMLERYVDADQAKALRDCFAGLYGLETDDDATKQVIAHAIANPSEYVLKPQREGGGNNLWNQEMVSALKSLTTEQRAAFILMKKINPKAEKAALLRKGSHTVSDCLSELGIYSAFVGDGSKTYHSDYCGSLLRTKAVGVDEGGVAAGFSCLSSVCYRSLSQK